MLPVAHSPLYGHCSLTTVKTDMIFSAVKSKITGTLLKKMIQEKEDKQQQQQKREVEVYMHTTADTIHILALPTNYRTCTCACVILISLCK